MAWITPKTDWTYEDVFTIEDYNRIRGNYIEVNNRINERFYSETIDFGAVASISTMYTASQFNRFEEAIDSWKSRTQRDLSVGTRQNMTPNGLFATPEELNRLEQTALNYYEWKISVAGIRLNKNVTTVNDTEQLTYEFFPSDATNQNVTWSSSDSTVATVVNGLIRAISVGECTITVTTEDGNHSDVCYVTVAIPVTGVTVWPTSASEEVGYTYQLQANITPSNAGNKNVTWSSSDTSIATVDQNGLVTCVAIGQCQIIATTAEGGFTAHCNFEVTAVLVRPERVELSVDEEVYYGRPTQIRVRLYPANVDNKAQYWSFKYPGERVYDEWRSSVQSWTDYADYSEGYLTVTPRRLGEWSFRCVMAQTKRDGTTVSGSTSFNVVEVPAEMITLSPKTITGGVGGSYTIRAIFNPDDTTNKTVTWSSSDTSIATITPSGYVQGMPTARVTLLQAGSVTITATTGELSDTATVKSKEGGTRFGGEVIQWTAMPTKAVDGLIPLVAFNTICYGPLDAQETQNPVEVCQTNGNDHIAHSNLLQWANTARYGWFVPQHEYDELQQITDTTAQWVGKEYIYYDETLPGFLDCFSKEMYDAAQMRIHNYTYRQNHLNGSAYLKREGVMAKVHLPNISELNGNLTAGPTAHLRAVNSQSTYYTNWWQDYSAAGSSSPLFTSNIMTYGSVSDAGVSGSYGAKQWRPFKLGNFRPIIYVRGEDIHLTARSTSANYDIDWTGASEITLASLTGNSQIFDTMGEPRSEEDIQEIFFQTRSLTINTGDGDSTKLRLYGYPNTLDMSQVTLSSPFVAGVVKGATGVEGDKAYIDLTISWIMTGDDTLTATLGSMQCMTALHVNRTAEKGVGTQFYDDIIAWYVASNSESEDGTDLTTLVSRDVLAVRHFDSKEPDYDVRTANGNLLYNAPQYGNERYSQSNILQWLNATGENWFVPQSASDTSPYGEDAVSSGNNNYPNSTKGFLSDFSAQFLSAMRDRTKDSRYYTVDDAQAFLMTNELVKRKVHLAAFREMTATPSRISGTTGVVQWNNQHYNYSGENQYSVYYGPCGSRNATLQAMIRDGATTAMAEACRDTYRYTGSGRGNTSYNLVAKYGKYTAASYATQGTTVAYPSSGVYNAQPSGIRPLVWLPRTIHVSPEPNSDGIYEIDWNGLSALTLGDLAVGSIVADYGVTGAVPDLGSITRVSNAKLVQGANTLSFSVTPKDSVAAYSFGFSWDNPNITVTSSTYNNGILTVNVNNALTETSSSVLTITARGREFPFTFNYTAPPTGFRIVYNAPGMSSDLTDVESCETLAPTTKYFGVLTNNNSTSPIITFSNGEGSIVEAPNNDRPDGFTPISNDGYGYIYCFATRITGATTMYISHDGATSSIAFSYGQLKDIKGRRNSSWVTPNLDDRYLKAYTLDLVLDGLMDASGLTPKTSNAQLANVRNRPASTSGAHSVWKLEIVRMMAGTARVWFERNGQRVSGEYVITTTIQSEKNNRVVNYGSGGQPTELSNLPDYVHPLSASLVAGEPINMVSFHRVLSNVAGLTPTYSVAQANASVEPVAQSAELALSPPFNGYSVGYGFLVRLVGGENNVTINVGGETIRHTIFAMRSDKYGVYWYPPLEQFE